MTREEIIEELVDGPFASMHFEEAAAIVDFVTKNYVPEHECSGMEEIRRELIEAKGINDFDDDDPFVGIFWEDLKRIVSDHLKREFYSGIWCSIQEIVAVHDQPSIATDIVKSSGISKEEMIRLQEASGSWNEVMYNFIYQF